MADKTITQLTATTSAATADEIPIWVAGSAVTRKITKANFLQGAFTGGGTVATGGFTLTVPATGTAALLNTANTWTASQSVLGANVGALLAASGDGQALRYVGLPSVATISLANGASKTLTFQGQSILLCIEALYGALLFITYSSATIVQVADPDDVIQASFINVTKSASSNNVLITNSSGTARNIGVLALGVITAIS